MDVVAHIEVALRRGNSPYTVSDVMRWLCTGQLGVAIGDTMSGSWRVDPVDGFGEIVHVGGQWNREDARWLMDRMKVDLRRRGVTTWKGSGRGGWPRFLKMQEFIA